MGKTGFSSEQIRTFTLVGHRSVGKTTIGDALLQAAGVTRSMGRVSSQTSLLDHSREARRRGMTLDASYAWLKWNEKMLQMVDTPGGIGLLHQTEVMIRNTDGCLLVISGPDGLETGSCRALELAAHHEKPTICVVNKIDRAHDLDEILARIQKTTQAIPVLMQLPLPGESQTGLIDLLNLRVLRYDDQGSGMYSEEPIPEALTATSILYRERAIESVALTDDQLLEQYLEYLALDDEQFFEGLNVATQRRRVIPVFVMAAEHAIGGAPLLDFLENVLPKFAVERERQNVNSAVVLGASVDGNGKAFQVLRLQNVHNVQSARWNNTRTGAPARIRKFFHLRGPRRSTAHSLVPGAIVATWEIGNHRPGDLLSSEKHAAMPGKPLEKWAPMMTYALRIQGRESQVEAALQALENFDHGLVIDQEQRTGRPTLAGHSQVQLERAVNWLEEHFGLSVSACLPEVEYRETIRTGVVDIEGLHERIQNGLVEEFGACRLEVLPGDFNCKLSFEAAVDEAEVPSQYIPHIENGVREGMIRGPSAGFPLTGLRVRCTGGEYDIMCSSDLDFKHAAERGLRLALLEGGSRILEPWKTIHVEVPQNAVGNVLSDLASRRARITGLEVTAAQRTIITAECPVRELRSFAPRLSALTGGQGWFETTKTLYHELPEQFTHDVISQGAQARKMRRTQLHQGLQADTVNNTLSLGRVKTT